MRGGRPAPMTIEAIDATNRAEEILIEHDDMHSH
jgi:hypothetical protein